MNIKSTERGTEGVILCIIIGEVKKMYRPLSYHLRSLLYERDKISTDMGFQGFQIFRLSEYLYYWINTFTVY